MPSTAVPAPATPRRARETRPPAGRGRGDTPTSHRSTWCRLNTWAGYLLLGVPAAVAIPALAVVVGRFGLWATATETAVPVLVTVAPLIAWIAYTRRRPATRRAALAWTAVATTLLTLMWFSPVFFGVGPVLALLVSEVACVIHTRRRCGRAARRVGLAP